MNPTSVVFLTSYGLSLLGNSVAAVVLPLVVLQTTGSALGAGVVAAATAVPAVLAGLVMGGLVDRVHRRRMSVATDVVSALAMAALPLVDLVTGLSLGWFVLFGILGSFGDVPGMTAREALLPGVARHADVSVDRLVALRESIGAVMLMVGPAVAAGLVVVLDGPGALWVTAATSGAAAATTLLLPRSTGEVEVVAGAGGRGSPRAALAHLAEGWSLLFRGSPFLRDVTLLNLMLASVLTAIQGLLLPVHFTALGQEGRLGLVLSSLALGLLLGSLAYAAVGPRMRRRHWFVLGMVGSVVGLSLVLSLPAVGLIFLGAVVLGVFGGMVSTVLGVLMVERIPDRLRGRVTGTQNAILTAAPSIGVLGAAVAIEQTSLRTTGVLVGGVWLVVAILALLVRSLRDFEPDGTPVATEAR